VWTVAIRFDPNKVGPLVGSATPYNWISAPRRNDRRAAAFALLYPPYNGALHAWDMLSGEHKVRPYNVADSTTGRAEGRSPSAFLSRPPLPKGDQRGLAWGRTWRWASAPCGWGSRLRGNDSVGCNFNSVSGTICGGRSNHKEVPQV
jgi:hypothetical protein